MAQLPPSLPEHPGRCLGAAQACSFREAVAAPQPRHNQPSPSGSGGRPTSCMNGGVSQECKTSRMSMDKACSMYKGAGDAQQSGWPLGETPLACLAAQWRIREC